MSLFKFHLRSSSISAYENSLCRPEVRSFDPLFPSQRKGGGGGGGGRGNLFRSRFMWPFSLRIFADFFIALLRNPVLRPSFPLFFSMDNLRGYGEDEQVSSSGLGRSVTKLPSSSEGPLVPTSSQAPVMADSTSAITLVTSGPVPAVSAPTLPASSVPKDSALALDDLPPPPPPAEPYKVFMARVQRDLSSLPVRSTQPGAAVPPRAAVATPTTGSRLPTPFPRFEDSSWAWALQPQAPNTRIRMPLSASYYVTPPSPWVWPGRGSSVATTMVRGPLPATLLAGPPGPCGPSGLLAGPSAVGPSPVPPPTTPAADLKKTSPPLRFRGFFPSATPPFIPTAPSSSVNTVAPTLTQPDAGTISQGPTPEMIKGWKEEFMVDMRAFWQQFVGDAPPQPTVGPSVTPENMGPDPLRQLSPSDDREASRAQHKTGSKRAGSNARRRSRSSERSSTDRHWARVKRPPASPDSSSPARRLSPPAKRSRWDQREISNDSSSSEGRQRSTRPRRPWQSRSPCPRRRDSSPSPSPHRRYWSSPAPSRCPSGANMTRRLARRPSLSPRRRSSSHHRRSRRPSRGRQSPPPSRSRDPHRRMTLSSSRSPSPKRHRTSSTSPRRHGSPFFQPGVCLSPLWLRHSPLATPCGRWWPASCQYPSTWFPWSRTIYLSGWISVVRGKSAETFCWSHYSSSSLVLCRSHTW